jgi:hypothetical protein
MQLEGCNTKTKNLRESVCEFRISSCIDFPSPEFLNWIVNNKQIAIIACKITLFDPIIEFQQKEMSFDFLPSGGVTEAGFW